MKKKPSFLYILICLLMLSCVTGAGSKKLPEADSENQTLVVATNTSEPGLIVYLQKSSGKETYLMQFGSGGLFHSVKIPQGSYSVSKYTIKNNNGNTVFTGTLRTRRIEIVNGKVNNLGTIDVLVRINEIEGGRDALTFNSRYDYTRNLFSNKNGSSNWNQREWINIEFDEPDSL